MADEIGPNLNPYVSYLDRIGAVAPIDRARGTTSLTPKQAPRFGKDGVRLSERSRRILTALAKGDTELDDPDYMRLRQLYQRGDGPEQVSQPDQGFPPELLALVASYGDGPVPALDHKASGGTGVIDRLKRAYYAFTL